MLVLRHCRRHRAKLKSIYCRRTSSTICESAAKELDSLAVHMPNLPDTDARTLALRMFYIGVSNRMHCGDAEIIVSQMFLVSPTMIRRWVKLQESTVEESLLDGQFVINCIYNYGHEIKCVHYVYVYGIYKFACRIRYLALALERLYYFPFDDGDQLFKILLILHTLPSHLLSLSRL